MQGSKTTEVKMTKQEIMQKAEALSPKVFEAMSRCLNNGGSDDDTDKAGAVLIAAALREAVASGAEVSDGWQLVPVEPDERQLDRAVSLMLNVAVSSQNGGWTEYARQVYRAMLDAAPTKEGM